MSNIRDAIAWLEQARSDARTAELVMRAGSPLQPGDVGCHVALLCAQSCEKCIKGCKFLVGQTPTLTHDVEKEIDSMLRVAGRHRGTAAQRRICDAFCARGVRRIVRQLLAWTPGNAQPNQPNYEYPWTGAGSGDLATPCGHCLFADPNQRREWVLVTARLAEEAGKIASAVRRGSVQP